MTQPPAPDRADDARPEGGDRASTTVRRAAWIVRRTPATIATIIAILVVGAVSGGLWEPFEQSPGMQVWAYGLPALEAGRWWTPVTGTFLVVQPWVYVPTILGLVGMAVLELLRGTRVALGYFWIGQLFAVLATALALSGLRLFSAWGWAQETAAALDVGASAGAFACIAAVVGLLPAPWRTRAWLVLLTVVILGVLVFGAVADLEHLAAVLLVLGVDRSLRPQRATVHEQRFIAALGMLAFVAIEVILTFLPTDGPFGPTEPLDGDGWSVAIDVVVVLLIARGLAHARRWAWVTAIVLLSLNVVAALLLGILGAVDAVLDLGLGILLDGRTELDIGTGFLALVMLVYLISVRGAFQSRRRSSLAAPAATTAAGSDGAAGAMTAPTAKDAAALVRRFGGGTLSWMTTWPGMSYVRTSTGLVAFQEHAGAAIALADPLGPADGRAASVAESIAAAERLGLAPCLFSVGEQTRAAAPAGWRSLVVADDTIVDLPGLEFTGKRWATVRTSLNRAGREEVSFRLTRLADEPWGVRAQLRAISEQWVGDKGLPEMRFTLGTLDEAEDPEVRLALAIDARGSIDGFLSWLPVYGDDGVRGWTLDLMRRREGGFPAVMEFLIGSSAAAFRDDGAEIMSLSGAPLAHEYPPEAQLIAQLSDRLAGALEPVYGFGSLHRFKEKFHPRYETLYLVYRDEGDLPRIGAGLTRAFLPDATARQFARAGLDLVRGGS